MLNAETLHRIATACLPKGATLKSSLRDGKLTWHVVKGKVDLMVRDSLQSLAQELEAEARKAPLVNAHPDTHLFGQPCRVEFAENRGEFYLVSDTHKVHLSWHGPSTRWIARDTKTGAHLKYGPKKDFKLAWSEKERQQPALAAWLTY